MLFGWFELDCEFGFLVFCVLGIFYELLKVYKVDNDGVLGVYWVGDIVYRWYIFQFFLKGVKYFVLDDENLREVFIQIFFVNCVVDVVMRGCDNNVF